MPIAKSDFWDDNYYNHPSLTDEMVAIAQEMFNVKLPELFIELLKIQNGGYTKRFVYPMTVGTTWAENHVPLSVLFGIVPDPTIKTAQNILDTPYMTEEWGLPEKQILLNGEGHWWITLDYRKGDIPSVRWIDVECDQDIHIADNFDVFMKGLVKEATIDD